ncbi:hypothetical protein GCM10023084_73060 [Streptomyces lacrimifluminis]|uniref:Uncharacterized protein n=1 Tax=Streptomyces lacrimifluminis TaxID=1500077 RepID=A0A917P689_9ACTN|nr:hypothetical protein [Streptomyces lacrimifluminis]GGJ63674.1 hypothetical protein GCM10012282_71140 [Streptomyces lacrimifluminis]
MSALRRRAAKTAGLLTATLASVALIQAPAAQAAADQAFTLRVKVTNANGAAGPADSVVAFVIKPDGTRVSNTCTFVKPGEWTDIPVSAPVGYTYVVWASAACYDFRDQKSMTVESTTTLFQAELVNRLP